MPDRRVAVVVAAILLGTLAGATAATPAAADSATSEEVRALAQQAQSDPAALDRLRAVDEIDGRPADLDAVLDGANGDSLARRLELLAGEEPAATTPSTGDAATDRAAAESILDGRKFNPVDPPRPFRGVLQQLGEWLEPVFGPIGRFVQRLADETGLLVLTALAVIGAAALVTARLTSRRTRAAEDATRRFPFDRDEDPAALERLADEAERSGDLDRAYRLRFRAGLLRLRAAGTVAYRPSLTTGQLARLVPSPHFAHLARAFDEIAYGGRSAEPDDLNSARQEWRAVLDEARR